MSSSFLQRFKGKTQQISKEGVGNILGHKNPNTIYQSGQSIKEGNINSVNFLKQGSQPKMTYINHKPSHSTAVNRTDNPFVISNPFYLDEEQRQREQMRRKEKQKIQQQRLAAEEKQKRRNDPKDITKTSSYSRNSRSQDKNNVKSWKKLGGLGPNIGGDEWLQRKKKLDKMQEFSGQVKNINAEKIKIPRPVKCEQKSSNTRQKALQYSKNVPKPMRKIDQQQYEQDEKDHHYSYPEEQLITQLQKYQLKHQKLKKMINTDF